MPERLALLWHRRPATPTHSADLALRVADDRVRRNRGPRPLPAAGRGACASEHLHPGLDRGPNTRC